MRFVSRFVGSLAIGLALAGVACAAVGIVDDEGKSGVGNDDDVGVDPYGEGANVFEPNTEQDAGAFSLPERPRTDAGSSVPVPDAGVGPNVPDAAPPPLCGALGAGSLLVVELMIKSIDGAGDLAEWVELRNPNDCTLEVPVGLRVVSPRGTASDVATVTAAFTLPPYGQFLAGGPSAPSGSSAPTLRWTPADTLKNTGDVIRIELGDVAAPLVVDSLTYPSFSNLFAARTVAFPSDCPAAARSNFANWSGSFADYPPGPLVGTPFAPNDDVTCAPLP